MLPDGKQHLLDYAQIGAEGLLPYDPETGVNVHRDNRSRRAWLKACDGAGIKDCHFHDLRKTDLTYLALNGATVLELQALAGTRRRPWPCDTKKSPTTTSPECTTAVRPDRSEGMTVPPFQISHDSASVSHACHADIQAAHLGQESRQALRGLCLFAWVGRTNPALSKAFT